MLNTSRWQCVNVVSAYLVPKRLSEKEPPREQIARFEKEILAALGRCPEITDMTQLLRDDEKRKWMLQVTPFYPVVGVLQLPIRLQKIAKRYEDREPRGIIAFDGPVADSALVFGRERGWIC